MNCKELRVGFAFCGSFCTMSKALGALEQTAARFGPVTPIVSETVARTDTRFGAAHDFMREMERICGSRVISTVAGAEPIGPKGLLDVLVICPCTGNTLAKLAHGVTDTAVTMAVKAHLRNGRPLVICPATNDGLTGSAPNLGTMLNRKHVFFVLRPGRLRGQARLPGGGLCAGARRRGGRLPGRTVTTNLAAAIGA